MTVLADFVRDTCRKPYWLLTGRATTALYLLLRARNVNDREVVLPVNVCYSLVNAVTMTGNRPRFVDTDPDDGNLRYEQVVPALGADTAAVIVVHNLGNPCSDLPRIAQSCRERSIAVVEDCAAALGGSLDGQPLGAFGDYCLFSFGAGKTIDASLGGLIAAGESLESLEADNATLPYWSPQLAEKTELFSRLYGLVYHSSFYEPLLARLAAMRDFFEDMYRFRLTREQAEHVERQLEALPQCLSARREVIAQYDRQLPWSPAMRRYPWHAEALPWRYTLLVDDRRLRQRCIEALLEAQVRVSAWYPPIGPLFGDSGDYPGARHFAERVLNLPLNQGTGEARRICGILRDVTRGSENIPTAEP